MVVGAPLPGAYGILLLALHPPWLVVNGIGKSAYRVANESIRQQKVQARTLRRWCAYTLV